MTFTSRTTRRLMRGTLAATALLAALVLLCAPAAAQSYTVAVRAWPPNAGTVTKTPNAVNYPTGSQVTVSAAPAPGWLFVGWDVFTASGSSSPAGSSFTMTCESNMAIHARFRPDPAAAVGGTVKAWGYNFHGQLGDNTTTQRTAPVSVIGLDNVLQVAGGGNTSLALRGDGTVWTWGDGDSGQLGDGLFADKRLTPAPIPNLTDVVSIAAGTYHALAVRADGTVWQWGSCLADRLNPVNDATPAQVAQLDRIVAVSARSGYAAALRVDGTVWTWGNNSSGQLGDGTTNNRSQPQPVPGLPPIVAIAAGSAFMLALDINGDIWGWGFNEDGQLGLGYASYTDKLSPVLAIRPTGTRFVAIGASGTFSMALDTEGNAWAWGENTYGLGDGTTWHHVPTCLPAPSNLVDIRGGTSYILAVNVAGEVYSWGDNFNGQLGLGDTTKRNTPVKISTLGDVGSVSASGRHGLAIVDRTYTLLTEAQPAGAAIVSVTPSKPAYRLGVQVTVSGQPLDANWMLLRWDGLDGIPYTQTVNGTTTSITFAMVRDTHVVAVMGKLHLTVSIRAWPPGAGSASVTPVKTLYDRGETITLQAAAAPGWTFVGWWGGGFDTGGGATHSFAITEDVLAVAVFSRTAAVPPRQVWSWGNNAQGQLGDGTKVNRITAAPVPGIESATAIAAGNDWSAALDEDGTVWAWGRNLYGQLGDGTTTNYLAAHHVPNFSQVIDLRAGRYHAVALRADGTVWAWGRNDYGQLGDGTTTNRSTPTQVPALSGVVAISACYYSTMALKADGSVWTWGYNNAGQLGDGTTVNRLSPVRVPGLTDIQAVAMARSHAAVLKSDGTVWAWGTNSFGELGDGTVSPRLSTVRTINVDQVQALACGEQHTMMLRQNGTAWACGYNASGRLGDGSTTNRTTAVQVVGLTNAVAISGTYASSLAITSDGSGWAWGYNTDGQLGDGTTTFRTTPVKILGLERVRTLAGCVVHSLALADGQLPPKTLAIVPSAGANVTGDPPGEYPHGAVVHLHCDAAVGYRLVKWLVNGQEAGTNADLAITMTEDKTVQAVCAFQLTLTVVNGTGSGTYDEGSVVPIAATVPPKHRFTGWTGDIATVADPAAEQTTITLSGNSTVTVNFERIIYPIEPELNLDTDFVYQNLPQTTQNRHRVTLTIEVGEDENENGSYEVEVVKIAGPGEVIIEATADPLVWHLVGSRSGVGATGSVTLEVRLKGDLAGESVGQVTLSVRHLGDITGDGFVNARDKLEMLRHLNGLATKAPLRALDLSGDAVVNAEDRLIINALLNGLQLP